ncbi:hypothetical protein B0O80DRAFT_421761 [Mortierella sp. GBAus27b]|nr:hypothetical protein B0O80DRAFT_421761 [Mortierella sp. GBAus27b]
MAERLPQMTWSWEVSGSMDARVSRIVDAEPEYSLDYESESRKNTKLQLKANRFCIITLAVASVLATTIGCGVKRGITANTWEFGPPLSPWPTLSIRGNCSSRGYAIATMDIADSYGRYSVRHPSHTTRSFSTVIHG